MNDANSLADIAVSALLEELDLFPKPGLVSPADCGSHKDMDYALLRRSAESLRESFREIAATPNPGFESLVELGLSAERRMIDATDGINTHRGAIFALGLLVAAAAADPESPRRAVQLRWSDALLQHSKAGVNEDSHGAHVRR
jgi:triphosphoribosyl-dephospho-CoA synthase